MSKLINISNATFIALHSVAIVASNTKLITIHNIGEQTGMSVNHIAKVIQSLVKYGYLKSVRGPKGGFVLGKNPEDIRLLELFELVEGKVSTDNCPTNCDCCPFQSCIFGGLPGKLSEIFRDYLQKTTLAEFLKHNTYTNKK